ncbi:hypothetical protein D3C84_690760 [compost metagenome]
MFFGLSGNQQQGLFSRLQTESGAQLQQGFLRGGISGRQVDGRLIENQGRVEQFHPIEHLVEQRHLILATGIGREVVHQRRELLRIDTMALVQVAIDP